MTSKKTIKYLQLVDEIRLDVVRRNYTKPEAVPSKKMIKEIIKSYEDLIVLYLTQDYRINTRMGKWGVAHRTIDSVFGVKSDPIDVFYPHLTFSKVVKASIDECKEQLKTMRESEQLLSGSKEKFKIVEWKLKDPQRDLTE